MIKVKLEMMVLMVVREIKDRRVKMVLIQQRQVQKVIKGK